ncbi:MAG: DEAD/DEAH box helicase [Patescibacteria group bacterium]
MPFSRRSRNSSRPYFRRNSRPTKTKKKEKVLDETIYTQAAQEVEPKKELDQVNFDTYSLSSTIVKALEYRGFTSPTEIQTKTIPVILEGSDLVAISQTGSGKTGSFLIPLLHRTKEDQNKNLNRGALIVAPTRELALQIDKELRAFDLRKLGLYSQTCIGGADIREQMRRLRKPNHFIIGTPGRLVDLVKREALNLSNIKTVVLDEMDRMLEMGFVEDITWLIEQIKGSKQSLFFSATVNKQVEPVLKKFAPNATYVTVNNPSPSQFVEQSAIKVQQGQSKLEIISEYLERDEVVKAIIFINTKSEVEKVANNLARQGFEVDYLHGDKSQGARTRTVKFFRRIRSGVLVATDVAARGLDISDISHVINYDEPKSEDDYIHRIGRTGRAGRFGVAVTLLNR